MELRVFVEDANYSDAVLSEDLTIFKDISDRVSTCSVTFISQGGLEVSRYGTALFDSATYGIDVRELYNIRIEDINGVRHFAGEISLVEFDRKKSGLLFLKCQCRDYTALLDRTNVPDATFVGQSDRAILQALIGTYAPTISATSGNIQQIQVLGNFEVKDKTLRQAIEELCELTGAEWRVDYNRNLLYFVPGTYAAPFGLSSVADFVPYGDQGTIWDNATQTWNETPQTWDELVETVPVAVYGIDAFTRYTRDFIIPINSCTVLGGFLAEGVEINVTYKDPISINQYGVRSHTIVDRQILVASDAILRAAATVRQHAYPEESFSLSTKRDGLDIGQSLPVYHGDFQVNGAYIIRSMRLKQRSRTLTDYELDLGAKPPDEWRLLRQIEARARRGTAPIVALPASGSVTTGSIGSGGISANVLLGGTISGVDIDINSSQIIGTITGSNVVVDAGTIQGVITGANVGVDVQTFEGVIVSSQVADNLIDRLSLLADSLRPIVRLASAPALPDPNYPENSFYQNTTDLVFYKNVGGTWTLSHHDNAVLGKLEYYNLGTIEAEKIVGQIVAAQIDQINASQIIGQIQAGNIGSVNASAIVGTISASNIGGVFANVIQGSITAGQISTVNAATITVGTLNSTQIGSVNAGTITTGSINAALITTGVLSANRVSGGSLQGVELFLSSADSTVAVSNSQNGLIMNDSSGHTATFAAGLVQITGAGSAYKIALTGGVLTGTTASISLLKTAGGSATLTVTGGIVTSFA
jgi:hypothetical protein